jgi:putative redox protein
VKVTARRREGFAHDVEIEGGHTIRVDEPQGVPGGTGTGPSPTRLVAAGLAACTAITMEMYADRKGWELGSLEVDTDVTYDGYAPTSYEVTLRLPAGLSDDQRLRLLQIAAKCPVHRVLSGETPVVISDHVEEL